MNITVKRVNHYGQTAYYPVDENAKRFAEISGTVTLPRKVLDTIKAMGVQINVVQTKEEAI